MRHSKGSEIKVSLIVSTYNWPQALAKCLDSILQLHRIPDEVIIADDGSGIETELLITSYMQKFPVPLKHVWHPDEGFQLAKIRNRAIAASSGDYIVQVDGDLILHPYFIDDHMALAQKGFFLTGSRVMLDKQITQDILENKAIHNLRLKNKKNKLNGVRSPLVQRLLARVYKIHGSKKYYVKGCNMSFWKNDLVKVNGYNETFTGWGREDSELAIRLINANVKKKFMKMSSIVFHLYHKEASRGNEKANIELMNNAILNKTTRVPIGLDQYL